MRFSIRNTKYVILNTKILRRLLAVLLLIALSQVILFFIFRGKASAAWYDTNWLYRKAITLTNNGSLQTSYVVPVVVDTASLISTQKMLANCNDVHFANSSGTSLNYFLETGCNTAKTVVFVTVDSIAASGTTTIYLYYGNPSAYNTSSYSSVPSGVYPGNGTDGAITIASDTNINTANSIGSRSCADGGDAVNYSVTANTTSGQTQVVLSTTPSTGCLVANDEVLIINLQGTSGDNSNVGKYEFARISSIATATLTLNHNLTNSYDGTTQKIMVQRMPNYTSVTVNSTKNFTASAWNGTKGGIIAFRADGTVTVTGNIIGNALGYRGGAGGADNVGGSNGESYDGSVGSGGISGNAGTSAGGAGQHSNTNSSGTRGGGGGGGVGGLSGQVDNDGSGGGGGGAYGGGGGGGAGGGSTTTGGNGGAGASTGVNAGGGGAGGGNGSLAGANGGAGNTAGGNTNATGGAAGSGTTTGNGGGGGLTGSADSGGGGGGGGYYGNTGLTSLFLGSGGGGAGGNNTAHTTGANGSTAGGIIFVNASTLTISGSIAANGDNATAAAASVGGGGAGSGGSIKLQSSATTLGSSLVTATGGSSVNGTTRGGGAGGGGVGRVAVNYSTVTGTTNPSATSTAVPVSGSPSSEELGPVAGYWKFDEGYGATVNNSVVSGGSGTLTGTTWQSADQCVTGKCLYFNGTSDVVTISGTTTDIQAVSFWVKPTSTTASMFALNGSAYITASSGTITATGFTSPTVYVNGKVSSTLIANQWNHIVVTTGTAISGSAITIGKANGAYTAGFIDDVKLFTVARTASQINGDYTAGSAGAGLGKGASAVLGSSQNSVLSNGLVGYWKMDEDQYGLGAVSRSDSSGNGLTLTDNNNTATGSGKFANAASFNGSNQYLSTATTINNVQTISFWVNPASTTDNYINLNGSTYITSSSGTVSATGATAPNIYVNGILNGTLTASTWNHIVVTTTTGISASSFEIGRANGSYLANTGKMDDVRLYNRAFTPAEVRQLADWAPGPVAYWRFDEASGGTVNDVSGNGNTGTWGGTGSHWIPGKVGSAGNFNLLDDYVSIGTPAILNNMPAMTINGWIYAKSGGISRIVDKSGGTAFQNGYLLLLNAVGTLTFDRDYNGATDLSCSATSAVSFSTWQYFSLTWDGSANCSGVLFYVNGVKQTTTTTTNGAGVKIPDQAQNLYIGNISVGTGGSRTFDGYIDELEYYNYTRSAKQIISDMNSGHPAVGSPVGSALGHWKFDEGYGTGAGAAHNSGNCGNTCDGTLTGFSSPATGTSGWTTAGKFNKALLYDGTGDYVAIPSDLAQFKITNDLTLSAWINLTDISSQRDIICKYTGTASTSAYCLYVDTNGKINMAVVNATGPAIVTTTGTKTLVTGTWYHVVGVFNSASSVTLYINGVQDKLNTTSIPTTLQDPTTILDIGAENAGSNDFNGKIDDAKIYNYALTANELLVEYNKGKSIVLGNLSTDSDGITNSQAASRAYCVPGDTSTCNPPAGEWSFNEGSGTSVNDTSGNGNIGTWNGTGSHWVPGKIGTAGKFNGTDDYVSLGDLADKASGTIAFWFKPDTTFNSSSSVTKGLWGKKQDDNNDATISFRGSDYSAGTGTTGTIISKVENGGGVTYLATATSSWLANVWYHYTLTWGSNTSKVYVNGILENTTASNKTMTGAANDELGRSSYDTANVASSPKYFDGSIDMFRVFDYVRTPAQVEWEYNQGKPAGWWKMNECSSSTANDSSGNSNNATITIGGSGTQTSVGDCTTNASTAWYSGRSGKQNASINLDGNDDYAATGNVALLAADSITYTKASWGGWIYPTTSVASKTILHKNTEFKLTTDANSKPICDIATGGGAFTSNTAASTNTALSLNAWNHVLCTYDGINLRVYVNGSQTDSWSQTNTITSSSETALNMGRDSASSGYVTGQIDDIRVFNYPLTATQVKTLINNNAAVRFGPLTGSP